MDQNFYNLLYNGYTGEFQLIGALYRNGLDALRPPADMGVDVVTVNLKAQLQDPSVQPETLMFQVKTAVVTVQEAGEGVRGYTTVYFMLKESEVDMLCAARTRALVCYVYDNRNSMLTDAYEAPFISFWIDGEHLRQLRESGAFTQADNGKLAITCQLREPADKTGHWYASVIDQTGRTVDNGYLGSLEADGNMKDSFDGADHYSIRGYLEHVRKTSSGATCDNRAFAKDASEKNSKLLARKPLARSLSPRSLLPRGKPMRARRKSSSPGRGCLPCAYAAGQGLNGSSGSSKSKNSSNSHSSGVLKTASVSARSRHATSSG